MRLTRDIAAVLVVYGAACTNPAQTVVPVRTSLEASSAGRYQIIDLGTSDFYSAQAFDVNSSGQVVGDVITLSGAIHPFLWENGALRDLGIPGAIGTRAINDNGQIIGDAYVAGAYRAWLWQDGVETDIGNLGGGYQTVIAINNAGQVVGQSRTSSGQTHVYFWSNGIMQDLGTLGGAHSFAGGMNNRGQVVGSAGLPDGSYHAFLWESGTMRDLGSFGGFTQALAINDAGYVVGTSADSAGHDHGFFWDGTMHDIGPLGSQGRVSDINNRGQAIGSSGAGAFLWRDGASTPIGGLGGGWTFVSEINSAGAVAGTSGTATGEHAYTWRDGTMYDLGTLGGRNSGALALNGAGFVVGFAEDTTVIDSHGNGRIHAVLWRPTDAVAVAAN